MTPSLFVSHTEKKISPTRWIKTYASWLHSQPHAVSNSATVLLTFQMPSIFLAPIRFSQSTKPRSKPLALEMNLAWPQWQAVSTGVSIISPPVFSQAILLKVLDACKLLTAAVNTSLQTLNRLPDLIDDRGCEDVTGVRECLETRAYSVWHI